jgi:hypothetical protein
MCTAAVLYRELGWMRPLPRTAQDAALAQPSECATNSTPPPQPPECATTSTAHTSLDSVEIGPCDALADESADSTRAWRAVCEDALREKAAMETLLASTQRDINMLVANARVLKVQYELVIAEKDGLATQLRHAESQLLEAREAERSAREEASLFKLQSDATVRALRDAYEQRYRSVGRSEVGAGPTLSSHPRVSGNVDNAELEADLEVQTATRARTPVSSTTLTQFTPSKELLRAITPNSNSHPRSSKSPNIHPKAQAAASSQIKSPTRAKTPVSKLTSRVSPAVKEASPRASTPGRDAASKAKRRL